jgi:hypothetical protein
MAMFATVDMYVPLLMLSVITCRICNILNDTRKKKEKQQKKTITKIMIKTKSETKNK